MRNSRVIKVQGLPPRESSMPTCALCRRQIAIGQEYALVRELDTATGLREVRHNTDVCLKYVSGPASALTPGALLYSFRYQVTEWGGTIPGRVVERTEEFNALGWRRYLVEPADPTDESPLDFFRNHREQWARNLGHATPWDPSPREVFISDDEHTHYVLPSPTH